MFCYECGAKVNSRMTKCVYCGADFNIMHELINSEKKQSEEDMFPVIKSGNGFAAPLGNMHVVFGPDMETVSRINMILVKMEEVHYKNFKEKVVRNGSLEGLMDEGIKKGQNIFQEIKKLSMALLDKNNIKYNDHELMIYYNAVAETFCEVYNILEMLKHESLNMQMIREAQKAARDSAPRSQWVGGGFGVKGAIKGAVTASALNLGGGLLRGASSSAMSLISQMADKAKINSVKKKLFSSGILQSALLAEFYSACNRHRATLAKLFINDKKDLYSERDDRVETITRLSAEIPDLDDTAAEKLVKEILEKYPCSEVTYIVIYGFTEGKYIKELLNIAGYFVNTARILDEFVSLDIVIAENNAIRLDDSDDDIKRKWNKLLNIVENSPAYSDETMYKDQRVIKFKKLLFKSMSVFLSDVFTMRSQIFYSMHTVDDLWGAMKDYPESQYYMYLYEMERLADTTIKSEADSFAKKNNVFVKPYDEKRLTGIAILTSYIQKIEKDKSKGINTFEYLASEGNSLACALLGECYFRGVGVEKNEFKADTLLMHAALDYNPLGLAYMGRFFAKGEMRYSKDAAIADELLTVAKQAQVPFAEHLLEDLRKER